MSRPSLSSYKPKAAPEPTPAPGVLKKAHMKHITVRMPPGLHRRIRVLTMHHELKIQAYIMALILADFEKRGLPVD